MWSMIQAGWVVSTSWARVNPGSAGVVDWVGQVPVEGMFDGAFSAGVTQFGPEGDELLVDGFVVGR